MHNTHVIILGAGISGLSLAYFLQKNHPDVELTLLDQKGNAGGVIESSTQSEFFFEKGPRTFQAARSRELLDLVFELNLQEQILGSQESAKIRYLWHRKKLQKVPTNPIAFLLSPLMQKTLQMLWHEWNLKPSSIGDETIYDFSMRHFGEHFTKVFIDAMVLGIFAGDIQKLSVSSCFPFFKELEKNYGSVIKGMIKGKKKPKETRVTSSLFTLKEGLSSLTEHLLQDIRGEKDLHFTVKDILYENDCVKVIGEDREIVGDFLFSALSSKGVPHFCPEVKNFVQHLESASLTVVNLGYREKNLNHKGFGYLVPTCENEAILGCIFDSEIFPEQNRYQGETRLSMMMRPSNDSKRLAIEAAKKHLNIQKKPDEIIITNYHDVIPQPAVGHDAKVQELEKTLREKYPRIILVGNYLHGVSINACIGHARKMAHLPII